MKKIIFIHDRDDQFGQLCASDLSYFVEGIEEIDLDVRTGLPSPSRYLQENVRAPDTGMLVIFGHGNPLTIQHEAQPILCCSTGIGVCSLEKILCYAVSCNTCDGSGCLGEQAVNKYGATAYMGYTKEFHYYSLHDIAAQFANIPIKMLIEGEEVGEIHKTLSDPYSSRSLIDGYLDKVMHDDASLIDKLVIASMIIGFNCGHFMTFGKADATLYNIS